ncbi:MULTISPECIES: host cell division inhibitor Icd-like protein [unclassified Gilliamella]|uniref:host cell division inhibitor Icd-like protein n=1 Tax=unclassified Gilliamella TaxID=2685620 RepID=UPI001307057E|nr:MULTISPECIES: host cell division inhibitor Icd-like protein [unclassified Gilliamella]MWP48442.1 host cell division inhibitor Icd-like protein [Gilliamella sp. Lep-s35]MWP68279.1 host cell division inhibitor Icd-like protein [Gilliamella sp. Lep-s5]MWP76582.1 host cell division inhibitor Icd-like protein [Gilliamella sp. Lep-s21]
MLKTNYKEKSNRETKLFKFYDLTTAKVFEALAFTEQQARKSLGKSSLIFIARIRLYPVIEDTRSFGGYHYGQ